MIQGATTIQYPNYFQYAGVICGKEAMIDLDSLWIGDMLKMCSSGRIGRYAGLNEEGKVRIDVSGKIYLTTPSNLELIPEKENFPDIDEILKQEEEIKLAGKKEPLVFQNVTDTLDLHIEKLAPHMEGDNSGRILDYQLQQSEAFIRLSIEKRRSHITIIHGKGQGVLREAITHQLTMFPRSKSRFPKMGVVPWKFGCNRITK